MGFLSVNSAPIVAHCTISTASSLIKCYDLIEYSAIHQSGHGPHPQVPPEHPQALPGPPQGPPPSGTPWAPQGPHPQGPPPSGAPTLRHSLDTPRAPTSTLRHSQGPHPQTSLDPLRHSLDPLRGPHPQALPGPPQGAPPSGAPTFRGPHSQALPGPTLRAPPPGAGPPASGAPTLRHSLDPTPLTAVFRGQ